MRNGNSIQWIESSGHNAYLIALMAHHLELMNSIDCRWILRFIPHLDSPMFVPAAHRSDTLSKRDPLLRPKLSVYVQIGSPHIVNAIRHWDEHLKEQLNDHLLCTVNLALESLGSELLEIGAFRIWIPMELVQCAHRAHTASNRIQWTSFSGQYSGDNIEGGQYWEDSIQRTVPSGHHSVSIHCSRIQRTPFSEITFSGIAFSGIAFSGIEFSGGTSSAHRRVVRCLSPSTISRLISKHQSVFYILILLLIPLNKKLRMGRCDVIRHTPTRMQISPAQSDKLTKNCLKCPALQARSAWREAHDEKHSARSSR